MPNIGFWATAGASSGGGAAYELIATAFGSGSSATVTFASIPAGYKHLQLRMVLGTTAAFTQGSTVFIRMNGITTANKTFHQMAGNGSAVNASSGVNQDEISIGYLMENGNATSVAIVDILDAFSTTKNKTFRMLNGYAGASGNLISLRSGLWPNTGAVTTIAIIEPNAYNWATRARFSLYGIKG